MFIYTYIIPFPLPFSIYSVRRAVAAAAAVNMYVDVIIVDFVGTGFDVGLDARNLLPQCHFVQLPPPSSSSSSSPPSLP